MKFMELYNFIIFFFLLNKSKVLLFSIFMLKYLNKTYLNNDTKNINIKSYIKLRQNSILKINLYKNKLKDLYIINKLIIFYNSINKVFIIVFNEIIFMLVDLVIDNSNIILINYMNRKNIPNFNDINKKNNDNSIKKYENQKIMNNYNLLNKLKINNIDINKLKVEMEKMDYNEISKLQDGLNNVKNMIE